MNSFGLIALVTLPMVLSSSSYYSWIMTPITLCMKSDYSCCTNVTYPTNCVNMDTVVMNGGDGKSPMTALKTIESVIVKGVEINENKCIVFFDMYNCQGHSLVLNGTKHPSANLYEFKFANLAVSYRPCTEKLLSWLRDNISNN